MADIRQRVEDYIRENRLLAVGDRVTVGVSGGADSVCLLLLLADIGRELELEIKAIYVEHGIRGEESREDGRFVRILCEREGVPFEEIAVDVPAYAAMEHLSTEEAARQLRYEALFRDAPPIVAVAHNADDNAETILYRLARGTGMRGLCGMRPSRRYEDGLIIRPLLCCERAEIETYLAMRGQTYRTDSTNESDRYARNRIRHTVLPALRELNSGAVRHINTTANELYGIYEREEERAGDSLTEARGEDGLSRAALSELPAAKRQAAIRSWLIERTGGRDIGRTHIDAAMRLVTAGTGKEISLPGGVRLCAEYDRLLLKRTRRASVRAADEVRLPLGAMSVGDTCELEAGEMTFSFKLSAYGGEEIPRKGYAYWFDYDKISNDLVVRNRQSGDYITIDRAGHHARLQDYLVNRKLPRAERDSLLLLCAGSEVLMIAGDRRGEAALVDETTTRVLEVGVRRGDDSA